MSASPEFLKRASPALAAILIAAAVALTWSGSLSAPFEFDDFPSIVDNTSIRDLGSLDWLRPPSTAGETVSGRPVLNFTLAVNYALGGLDVRGYRIANILIHTLAALTLLGVVRRTIILSEGRSPLAGDSEPSPASGLLPRAPEHLAFTVAFLWALHPLHTGAVTYIVQRAESLCGLFALLTLYCFARGAECMGWSALPSTRLEASAPSMPGGGNALHLGYRSRLWFIASAIACALAVGTKEVAVVVPLVVLLYDRALLTGSFAAALRARWSVHAALFASWILLAFLVVPAGGRGGSAGFETAIAWWDYALTQCGAIVHYLRLAVWPHPLVFDYGTPLVRALTDVWWQASLLLLLYVAALWTAIRRPRSGFLPAAFFLILAPSSSFVPVATQTVAEHRMYLPLAAVVVLLVAGVERILRRLRAQRAALFVVPVVAIALGAATHARNRVYASGLALWQDTAAKVPANPRAQHNLGLALAADGRDDEAIACFEQAIRLQPNHAFAHFSLATLLERRGRIAEAESHYRACLIADPDHTGAGINLGAILVDTGRAADALGILRAAVASEPNFAEAHFQLGRAIEAAGGGPRVAVESYRAAIQLRQGMAPAHLALANALAQLGELPGAERSAREAVRLDAGSAGARFVLGNILAAQQRFDAAIGEYRESLRLDPERVDALANLGNCMLMTGRFREAAEMYEHVLRLRPGDKAVQENLRLTLELSRSGSRNGN